MAPLPVTAAQALLTSLGNQAKFFFGTDNRPPFDTAGFIATEDPAPIALRPAKQIARAACRAWARQPGPSSNPSADRLYASACGEYLDSIGEGVDPGTIGPPFEGGQCDAIYLVSATQTTNLSGTTDVTFRARGPIGGVRIRQVSGNNYDWEVFANNVNFSSTTCGSLASGTSQWYRIGGLNSSDGDVSTSITSIVPCGVDDCGNPPPEYERPRPPITLPPITPIFIDLPDIGEINVNVTVDAEGLITIESPTLDVEVNIGGPNDGTGDDGGGVDGGDLVPDGGIAESPADTGDGGTASGCAPGGQELVGVRVEVLEAPVNFNSYANQAAVVYRGIGYVRMGYPGRLALCLEGSAVISPQFFLAPVRGLTCWEVRANNGFINRVTPYYRELPS